MVDQSWLRKTSAQTQECRKKIPKFAKKAFHSSIFDAQTTFLAFQAPRVLLQKMTIITISWSTNYISKALLLLLFLEWLLSFKSMLAFCRFSRNRKGILVCFCTVILIVFLYYKKQNYKKDESDGFCSCDRSMITTTLSPLDFIVGYHRSTPDHLPDLRRLTWPRLPFPNSKPIKSVDTHFRPRVSSGEYKAMHFFVSAFASAMYNIGCGDRWFAHSTFTISLKAEWKERWRTLARGQRFRFILFTA